MIALCDALGFEVEVEYGQDHEALRAAFDDHYYGKNRLGWNQTIPGPFPYNADDFKKPVGYKLTKKKTETPKPIPE